MKNNFVRVRYDFHIWRFFSKKHWKRASYLDTGFTSTDGNGVKEVNGNADHRTEGDEEAEDLRPCRVLILVVRQQLKLDALPQEDELTERYNSR